MLHVLQGNIVWMLDVYKSNFSITVYPAIHIQLIL